MRWLVTMTLFLTLLLGCAPTKQMQFGILEDFLEEFTQAAPSSGWKAGNETGTSWHFTNSDGYVIGACHMIKKSPELWFGKVLFYRDDFGDGEIPQDKFSSLCECVEWVEHYVYGNYYI